MELLKHFRPRQYHTEFAEPMYLQQTVPSAFQAPGIHPHTFLTTLAQQKALTESAPKMIPKQHGTTTLAFIYQGGIIVSVDSRSTMGYYISSGNVHKVIPITEFLLGTMAGGAADCQFWLADLANRTKMHELESGQRLGATSVSKMFADTIYQYKGYDLSIGSMIAGFDEDGTPKLYYCDNDGDRLPGNMFSVGSGSPFAYSILENNWKYDLTDEEAVDLGLRAIMHAVHRDAMSGGNQAVFIVRYDGWKLVKKQDNYKTMQQKGFAGVVADVPKTVG